MQERLVIWTSKQTKAFLEELNSHYGSDWHPECAFIANSKGKVWIVSRDLGRLEWEKLRLSSVGLYIAEVEKGGIRLSIEGSQLVGPTAKRNVVDVDEETAVLWLKGEDVAAPDGLHGYVIVRSGKDCLGSGHCKDSVVRNAVAKARRLSLKA